MLRRAVRAAALAVILAVACSGCANSASHAPVPPTSAAARSSSPGPRTFAELAGDWYAHDAGIDIQPDGRFVIVIRTYRVCGQVAPPCDTIRGNEIIPGDRATGQLTSGSGGAATGVITHTTDPSLSPEGPVKIDLHPSTDSISVNEYTFCGTKAPVGYCGA
jgi:hypothetical protein